MAYVKSMVAYVVAGKKYEENMDLLWDGFDENEGHNMFFWPTKEEALGELATRELAENLLGQLRVYEAHLAITGLAK